MNFKKIIVSVLVASALVTLNTNVFAIESNAQKTHQQIIDEATPVEGESPLNALSIQELNANYPNTQIKNSKVNIESKNLDDEGPCSSSKKVKSYTNGTLRSQTWLSYPDSEDLFYYLVSAKYDKTDHQKIRTTWYVTLGAKSRTSIASAKLSFESGDISVSTTSTVTNVKSPAKYYENTKSQTDSSWGSNIAVQGEWSYLTLTNTAKISGNKLVKYSEIISQVTHRS